MGDVHDQLPRILIVEDDARLAELVREYLADSGFEVLIEGRGDGAVERILAWSPEVVILDLMLLGMDGLSDCRAVRSRFDGAILMLTARGVDARRAVEGVSSSASPSPARWSRSPPAAR